MKTLGKVIRTAVKEPLLWFMSGAAILYAINATVNPTENEDSSYTIVVTRDSLLRYMQFRLKAFDAEHFAKTINSLPENELDQLVDDYVREEVLYREAKLLQLDQNDYLAKRRLITQMEFLVRGLEEQNTRFEQGEIETFFSENTQRYNQPATLTFTHIFFSGPEDQAKKRALSRLDLQNRNNAPFSSAIGQGDRFLYHTNYVKKDLEELTSHFGEQFARNTFALPRQPETWQGPIRSDHGWHIILLTEKNAELSPALEDIWDDVLEDATLEKSHRQFEQSISSIVDSYSVQIKDQLQLQKSP